MRIGFGAAYTHKDGNENGPVRKDAQRLYLRAVGKVAPAAIEELAEQISPMFEELLSWPERHDAEHVLADAYAKVTIRGDRERFEPGVYERHELMAGIIDWLKRWGLAHPEGQPYQWARQEAISTLQWWAVRPERREQRVYPAATWQEIDLAPGHVETKDFTFTHQGWQNRSTFEAWKAEARLAFEAALEKYLAPLRQQYAESRFMEETPEKREPAHFEWLARREVLGMSIKDIAETVGQDEATVRSALAKVRKLVGIAGKRGRAKGRKDTNPGARRVAGRPNRSTPRKG